jgi:hypothetical protein
LSALGSKLVPANSGCRAAIGSSEDCHFFGQWRKRPDPPRARDGPGLATTQMAERVVTN